MSGLLIASGNGVGVRRFDDRYISPTLVDDLVAALLEMTQPFFGYRGMEQQSE